MKPASPVSFFLCLSEPGIPDSSSVSTPPPSSSIRSSQVLLRLPKQMNNVEAIRNLNERELELGLAGTLASWHDKYSRSAVVYVGGLSAQFTESTILSVFEQVGRIVHLNLVRDTDCARASRGYAFARYADPRSAVLAVDNFNAAVMHGRRVRVDHVLDYRPPDPGECAPNPWHCLEVKEEECVQGGRKEGVRGEAVVSRQREERAEDRVRVMLDRLHAMRRKRTARDSAEIGESAEQTEDTRRGEKRARVRGTKKDFVKRELVRSPKVADDGVNGLLFQHGEADDPDADAGAPEAASARKREKTARKEERRRIREERQMRRARRHKRADLAAD